MDPRSNALILEYRRQREALLAEFPELAEDIETLADTMEGISYAPELISEFVRGALDDEATAEALNLRLRDMAARKERLISRAERRRLAATRIMNAIELRKLEQPDFTASIRAVPPKVEVYSEEMLPDEACKIERKPDRTRIKELLADGPVAGARLTNGTETLTIRTR